MALSRSLGDYLLRAPKAFPAANAANFTDTIDLGPGFKGEDFELELSVPALPALTDNTKSIAITLKDSADGVTFAAIPELATLTITGVTTTGPAATVRKVRIPSTCRRYVRADASVPTGGGDNTTVSYLLRVLV
jgi:hypothetical protein